MISSIAGATMGMFSLYIVYSSFINAILSPDVSGYFLLCTGHSLYKIVYRNNMSLGWCYCFREYFHLLWHGTLILAIWG